MIKLADILDTRPKEQYQWKTVNMLLVSLNEQLFTCSTEVSLAVYPFLIARWRKSLRLYFVKSHYGWNLHWLFWMEGEPVEWGGRKTRITLAPDNFSSFFLSHPLLYKPTIHLKMLSKVSSSERVICNLKNFSGRTLKETSELYWCSDKLLMAG